MEFDSAGILFEDKDNSTFLSGWNPKQQAWSGFGGKRRGNETAWETALREVIEELFGIFLLPVSLNTMQQALSPMEFFQTKKYVCFIMPLTFVFRLSEMLEMIEYKSPFYKVFPQTKDDLLLKRTIQLKKTPEITELCFLKSTFTGPIDFYFKSDILTLKGDSESD